MSTTRKPHVADFYSNSDEEYPGFDVVCSIGHVSLHPDGELPPHVAAFKLIAEHDARGVFQFPMADGRTCTVSVDWPDDPPER